MEVVLRLAYQEQGSMFPVFFSNKTSQYVLNLNASLMFDIE